MQKGAILQLTLKSDMDKKYLIGNPKFTFFRSIHKHHVNFAIQSVPKYVKTEVDFGKKMEFELDHKDGDLITDLWLVFKLPTLIPVHTGRTLRWTDAIGHAIIKSVSLWINNERIVHHPGEFLEIYNNLTMTVSHEEGNSYLVGRNQLDSREINTVYVPLKFWFCNNFNQAYPLVATQNNDFRVIVELRDFNELWITNHEDSSDTTSPSCIPKLEQGYILADVAYLDNNERKWFAENDHNYLIKQVQLSTHGIAANIREAHYDMNFHHSVSELIWVIQRLDSTDSTYNDWFNYSSQRNPTDNVYQDSLSEAKISFSGNDLLEYMDALYYRIVQPLKYHTRVPERNVYDYCFSLYPESYHATGSANFSAIDNKLLHLRFIKGMKASRLNMYAINFNILHITKGIVAIEYT